MRRWKTAALFAQPAIVCDDQNCGQKLDRRHTDTHAEHIARCNGNRVCLQARLVDTLLWSKYDPLYSGGPSIVESFGYYARIRLALKCDTDTLHYKEAQQLNHSKQHNRIGIDLGGSKIEGIVLGHDHRIVHRKRIATPASSYEAILESLCQLIADLQSTQSETLSVGIGTPGSPSPQSGLMRNSNTTVLNGKNLQADFENKLGYAVRLENDANCFALSEALLGAGMNAPTVFGVIIGTGTGGGFVINGKLLSGANAIAGEWGHNTIPASARELLTEDRPCYCGRKNCIETVLCGSGLVRTHQELHGNDKVQDANIIAQLAEQGDRNAIATLRRYSEQLAACLATVINTFDPHTIVLGGGLSNIESLYDQVHEFLPTHVFSDVITTKIVPPVHGDASGTVGGACLWS